MDTHTCAQRGCEFEADELPENCPVCNNPIINGADADEPWDLYGVEELKEVAREWGLSGYSNLNKADLVELIKAAEADDSDDDNGDDNDDNDDDDDDDNGDDNGDGNGKD